MKRKTNTALVLAFLYFLKLSTNKQKRKNKESFRPSYSNSISLAAVRAVEWGLVFFTTSNIIRLRLCSYFASLAQSLKFLPFGQVVFCTLLPKTVPSLLQVRSLRSTPPYKNFNFFLFPFSFYLKFTKTP